MAPTSVSVDQSRTFFHPQPSRALAPGAPTPPDPDPKPTGGLISYILASASVSPAAQASLDQQRNYLTALMGLASSYARKAAIDEGNPDLLYETTLWENIFNNLPLLGGTQFETQIYRQESTAAPTKLLENILSSDINMGPAPDAFGKFLSGLGDSIQLGLKTNKTYELAVIGAVLRAQAAQPDKVEAYLRGYWIDFSESQNIPATTPADDLQSMAIEINYTHASSLFNVAALDDPNVKKSFDAFLKGTQIDDIAENASFFSASFPEPSLVSSRLAS